MTVQQLDPMLLGTRYFAQAPWAFLQQLGVPAGTINPNSVRAEMSASSTTSVDQANAAALQSDDTSPPQTTISLATLLAQQTATQSTNGAFFLALKIIAAGFSGGGVQIAALSQTQLDSVISSFNSDVDLLTPGTPPATDITQALSDVQSTITALLILGGVSPQFGAFQAFRTFLDTHGGGMPYPGNALTDPFSDLLGWTVLNL